MSNPIAAPSFQRPFVDGQGLLTPWARLFLAKVFQVVNAVDTALAGQDTPAAASIEIIASSGLTGGGDLSENVSIRFGRGAFEVASLPTAQLFEWAYALNGRKAGEGAGAGTGTWVWYDNANWRDFSGETVSA